MSRKTKKLLAAIAEATVWLKANPAEAWEIFSKSGKEFDNDLNKLAWKDTLPLLADDPTALDRARYETFAAFLVKRGLIKQAPAARQLPARHEVNLRQAARISMT